MGPNQGQRRRILSRPNAITMARIEKGLTVGQLATLASVNRSHIYAVEARANGVSEPTALAISRHLGKPFGELFDIVRPSDNGEGETSGEDVDFHQMQPYLVDPVQRRR